MTLNLFSPAKINLFLRILKKRSDGYHELASLFQAINLGDTLTFSLADKDQFTCTDSSIPTDSTNLVIKTLNLFRQKTNLKFSIHIHLEKNIPIQAGLGGGSSNAATTLWALNKLHNHPATEKELQTWSAEIGSDIPFFFSHGTAYCTGRGENVRDLPPPPSLGSLSVYKPHERLATPAIYKALKLNTCSKCNPEKLLNDFYLGNFLFVNDLEKPAFELCPSLKLLKQKLESDAMPVFMTGSGTAFIRVGKGNNSPINRKSLHWY